MKVIHLISSFSAAGAEILAKDIAFHTKGDICVEVWASGQTPDVEFEKVFLNELTAAGIPARKIGKERGRGVAGAVIRLRSMIREHKPDIIHTHNELVTFYSVLASAGLKVKITETVHNTVLLFPKLSRFLFRHFVDRYVAISKKCMELILNDIGADKNKVQLIYNGIKLEKFQNRSRVIRTAVASIAAVGRLDVQKDYETMLKAYALLMRMLKKENITLPVLNICGTGPFHDKLVLLASELGISGNVRFLGLRNDIPSFLYENDIWLMTSKWEGLSIALLEALASGIPAAASDVGSNSELIENGVSGVLFPKESPERTAEVLFELIKDKARREYYSENAMKKAAAFSIEKCADEYSSLHLRLFEEGKMKAGLRRTDVKTGIAG